MPPLHLLIKPASGQCNMCCAYCFYADVASCREVSCYGIMSRQTMEVVIRRAMEYAIGGCTFSFQGGEPTLAGLDFYHDWVQTVARLNKKGVRVQYALQTNGVLIDREWAQFFAQHGFLLGLSLDGVKELHDENRTDAAGRGTYSKVMRAAQLLCTYGVDFNILTVVTPALARNIERVYSFYGRNGFAYQQYIPCLPALGETFADSPHATPPREYGDFLIRLFGLWHRDLLRRQPVSIRYFDNLAMMLRGAPPESCDMCGRCSLQYVVEADGSVYPCDFYVLDEYRMGNLNEVSLEELRTADAAQAFLQGGSATPLACQACRWLPLCRGGCRRHREPTLAGDAHNVYCEAYKLFFERCYPQFEDIVRSLPMR